MPFSQYLNWLYETIGICGLAIVAVFLDFPGIDFARAFAIEVICLCPIQKLSLKSRFERPFLYKWSKTIED